MVKKVLFSIVLFFAIAEILIRISGKFKTSNERVVGEYYYRYHQSRGTWLHHWKPNKTVDYTQPEFRYQNAYNEFGLREMALDSFVADTSTLKVLCLGDSFTEGDGAPFDSSWVKRIGYLSKLNGKSKYRFYNAGACGSDVFFNHQWLSSGLMKMKPVKVIECVNASDVEDVLWFGGSERFNMDGTTSGKIGPRWEIYYKYFHIVRAFVHKVLGYNSNLVMTGNEVFAIGLIKDELIKTNEWCKANGIVYTVVLQLCPHELKLQNKVSNQLFVELAKLDFVTDISDEFQLGINSHNYLQYSWQENGHFNSLGYQKLGDLVYKYACKDLH
ncbi:MAG: hypothetical protein SGJ00_07810 [bacterium]|nr:hypothetical protein [bacterium]